IENDLAKVVVETAYHSDELFEMDIKLAKKEKNKKSLYTEVEDDY
ncbi:6593_t:CDS:1, partial [Dentiscutata heterogama]